MTMCNEGQHSHRVTTPVLPGNTGGAFTEMEHNVHNRHRSPISVYTRHNRSHLVKYFIRRLLRRVWYIIMLIYNHG